MITAAQFESLHTTLKTAPLVGTFLHFRFSMDGKPSASFTHGEIQFDDFADLERWLKLTDQQRWEEASQNRLKQ